MNPPKIYIETTIPSFYHEIRTDIDSLARKNWTQHWWDFKRREYDLVTSEAVIRELENGDYPTKKDALALLEGLPILEINYDILELVETYIARKIMPAEPAGDALHLALASYYGCDFLLTWNCRHLANPRKFQHIRRINVMLNVFVPILITPVEFLEEDQ
jgi:predicted nucleic acid-binding protein